MTARAHGTAAGPDPCPPHMPVTQDVVKDGKVVTVRMCSRCGATL